MLELIRKHRSSILGTFVLCIVAVFMLSFGLESYIQPQSSSAAIRIDDYEISSNQYYGRIRRLEQVYRRQLGENYEQMRKYLNLEQNTADTLIDEYLLQKFIERIGLHAGIKLIEHRIREDVASIPQLGNTFNDETLKMYMRARGVTGAQLEVETGQSLKASQISGLFRDTALVSEPELKSAHMEQHTSYQFNYVKLESKDFEEKVDLNAEEEIQAFFDKHIEEYRKPRSVAFEYVEFRPADFTEQVQIHEEDVTLTFRQRRHEFREPTKYHFRQIVLYREKDDQASKLEQVVTGGADKEESFQSTASSDELKKERLEAALKRLDDGELFEDVARDVTEDEAGKETGGDLGLLAFNELAEYLKKPAKDLDEDQFSEVIEGPDGFYVLYLQERKEGREKSVDEVRDVLEKSIREQESVVYARAAAYDFLDAWQNAGKQSLEEAAKKHNYVYAKLEKPVFQGSKLDGFAEGMVEKVVNLPLEHREVIEIDDFTYVIKIYEANDSFLPELEDVRDEVIAAYKKEAAVTLAKAKAEELRQKLQEAPKEDAASESSEGGAEDSPEADDAEEKAQEQTRTVLADTAKEFNLELKETSVVNRNSAISEPFNVGDLKTAAFALTPENPLSDSFFEHEGSFYFVELKELTRPEEKDYLEAKDGMEQAEINKIENRMQSALIAHLRANSDIWIDPQLLARER